MKHLMERDTGFHGKTLSTAKRRIGSTEGTSADRDVWTWSRWKHPLRTISSRGELWKVVKQFMSSICRQFK